MQLRSLVVVLAPLVALVALGCQPSAPPSPPGVAVVAQTGDVDHDGIIDGLDACPYAPEDVDGFDDGDGCPDTDNDGDGVLDVVDKCPNQPRVMGVSCLANTGCPSDCWARVRAD